LTFDDGPRPSTPELIAVLNSLNVNATFFIVGGAAELWADEFDALCESGHEIGNHTWSHPRLTLLDEYDAIHQLEQTSDLIESCSGQRPRLFRPPYGATDDDVTGIAAAMGMATITWNIDPRDYNDANPEATAEHVISMASSGSIILMHEGHPNTLLALPIIVNALRAEGYKFVTVGEMLGLHPGVACKQVNEIEDPIKPSERGLF
jgi:peptidoglycan/xylan/chitin deacetylase (PgdA/CDA1 family)